MQLPFPAIWSLMLAFITLVAAFIILLGLCLLILCFCFAHNKKIYLGLNPKVFYRVYIFPNDPIECKMLSESMARVSILTLGEPLNSYPIMCNEPGCFQDKVVVAAFDAVTQTMAGFQCCILLEDKVNNLPAIHLGLFMVLQAYRGANVQKWMGFLGILAVAFSQRVASFYVSDLGASAPGTRAFCDIFENVYPHYLGHEHTPRQNYHLQVAQMLVSKYRRQTGISANASFEEGTFVVRGSNLAEGGGAYALISAVKANQTSSKAASTFLSGCLDVEAGDEIVHVGLFRLLPLLYRPVKELLRKRK